MVKYTEMSSCMKRALGLSVAILLLGSWPAAAYDWSWGDVDLSFDSTFAFGLQVRTENVDPKNYCTTIGGPNALTLDPDDVVPDGAGRGPGGNGDCGKSAGNLNYEKGSLTSTIFKGIHEFDVQYDNYSALVRFHWWYDGINQNGTRARTPLSDEAKWESGAGIQLLDAYVQGNWYPADMPVSLKVGNVVLNWGESTFLQNGLNVTNPIDVRKLRVPGAELREALLAVPQVWASFAPTDWVSVEGFYQFWWEETKVDAPGTFFSTHDAVGPGGQFFDISQGHHDCDIDSGGKFPPDPNVDTLAPLGLRHDGTVGLTCIRRGHNQEADSQGQFGFALRFFVPQLAGTELGAFFLNTHSRLPIISGSFQEDFNTAGQRLFGAAWNPASAMAAPAMNAVLEGTLANQYYPEDIKKVGLSWSTALDQLSMALQGEFAYTIDQPMQLSEIELLAGLLSSAGIPGAPTPSPGTGTAMPGEFYSGAVHKDMVTAQMTMTYVGEPGRIIGGWLKASQFLFVTEMGYLRVVDYDDPNYLPLQGTVTPQSIARGNTANQPSSFGTRNSMGYVIRAALPYNNLIWGVNVKPFVGWSHGFWGVTPAPMLNYAEGSMSANVGVGFDYQNAWSSTIGYTTFFGGGADNPRNDRDFFSFDIKYSF